MISIGRRLLYSLLLCYPFHNDESQTSHFSSKSDVFAIFLAVVKCQYPAINLIQIIVGGSTVDFDLGLVSPEAISPTPWRFWDNIHIAGSDLGRQRAGIKHRYGEAPGLKIALLWIGVTLVLSEAITIVSTGEFPRILYTIMPIIAVFYLPGRWSLAITIGTLFWVMLSVRLFPIPEIRLQSLVIVLTLATYLGGYALAYALLQEGRARKETQHLLRELADSNEQLTRYAAEAAELATIRERNRIAREIHDSLGHCLTIVGVQLEKAIIFDAVNRDEAVQAVKTAKRLTDQALGEVRHSVGTLRESDETFKLRADLQALVENIQHSGLVVHLRWRGDETGLSEQQVLTLFRAAQEGLTNVQKHAQAQQVQIDVALDAETAVLKLTDNGVGIDSEKAKNGGYGLQGLGERVKLVRGTMTLGRIPTGGTQLVVTLPREDIL